MALSGERGREHGPRGTWRSSCTQPKQEGILEASTTLRPNAGDAGITAQRVCWEVTPGSEVRAGARVHAGLLLTLLARDPRGLLGDPSDPERVQTWRRLRDLAQRALPGEGGWSLRPEPFDRSWHLRSGGDWEPEILFSAMLEQHQPEPDRAPAERRLGLELRRGFEQLGVREARG